MGFWNITIQGMGIHHNHPADEKDANRMAKEFVQSLRQAGHSISSATFTCGGSEDVDVPPPVKPA
jgi:hypothetical protein